MSGARWRLVAVSLLAGVAISRLKLLYVCRAPTSEACVWGKAYDSIGFPIETLAFGGIVFVLLLLYSQVVRR